nr:MAG TPA: hypothetical protein [Caudoviricetes sp.]
MAMIGHLIRIISCAAAVVIRTDYVIIIPDLTRGEHSAFVFMPSRLPGGQFLPGEFTGFATDANLHSGQVSLLEGDGIAAAALPDVRTISLADADRFVFAGVHPFRPRPALIGIKVLVKKAGGSNRVIIFPEISLCRRYRIGNHLLYIRIQLARNLVGIILCLIFRTINLLYRGNNDRWIGFKLYSGSFADGYPQIDGLQPPGPFCQKRLIYWRETGYRQALPGIVIERCLSQPETTGLRQDYHFRADNTRALICNDYTVKRAAIHFIHQTCARSVRLRDDTRAITDRHFCKIHRLTGCHRLSKRRLPVIGQNGIVIHAHALPLRQRCRRGWNAVTGILAAFAKVGAEYLLLGCCDFSK